MVLMGLMSANRSSDLHTLDLKFRRYTPEGVIFTSPILTKARSGPSKESFYYRFIEDILCPVHTLKIYEQQTKSLRTKDSNKNSPFVFFQ